MKFFKVSFTQFEKDIEERLEKSGIAIPDLRQSYEDIKLPIRATKGSAGYDFFAPFDFSLAQGQSICVPTGIRAKMENNIVLLLAPRSSLGFKYRMQLDNTIGVIDADYFGAKNEGHIMIKITNDSKDGSLMKVEKGKAFAQGIFLKYEITEDDVCEKVRTGGEGSSDS
ncbi:MAG: deoxyuridine 5'-triphosphate nucleotidohydrolase [Lachnospiraceae bacterium]|nr:deoxyuridine 5'-triphosphate nucleotidohydrolase [Lachnospiraceae bacterium]